MKLGTTKIQNESGMIKVYNFFFYYLKISQKPHSSGQANSIFISVKTCKPRSLVTVCFHCRFTGISCTLCSL